jgi:hypothetical protein
MKRTIQDLQAGLEQRQSLKEWLKDLTPPGCRPNVELRDGRGKYGTKKRKDAAADNWVPLSGSIEITFARLEGGADTVETPSLEPTAPVVPEVVSPLSQQVTQAILALDSAENKLSFVALKWFRDQFLPKSGSAWAAASGAGQKVIEEAIERNIFLPSKVHNPKSPAFPTTRIRLNRQSIEVQRVLGSTARAQSRFFRPVEIRGAGLSDTILQDRG